MAARRMGRSRRQQRLEQRPQLFRNLQPSSLVISPMPAGLHDLNKERQSFATICEGWTQMELHRYFIRNSPVPLPDTQTWATNSPTLPKASYLNPTSDWMAWRELLSMLPLKCTSSLDRASPSRSTKRRSRSSSAVGRSHSNVKFDLSRSTRDSASEKAAPTFWLAAN